MTDSLNEDERGGMASVNVGIDWLEEPISENWEDGVMFSKPDVGSTISEKPIFWLLGSSGVFVNSISS